MEIAVLPGDDIGPEITDSAMEVMHAADKHFSLGLTFQIHQVGMASYQANGTTLPESVINATLNGDGVLLGPAGITAYPPVDQGGVNIPATIRKRLDLYANIRPFRTRQGIPNARPRMDLVFVRENTEGFYSDRNMFAGIGEFMPTEDVALSVRKITAHGSRRIARVAFEMASQRRGIVTAVGKEHVLRMTDGLFIRQAREITREFSDVQLSEMDVDTFAAALYTNPSQFDVILITNMFGDILSNLAASMSGGIGLAAALNAGDNHAAANAGHGSAPDIAGKDVANPTGLILSTAMLLEWLGKRHNRSEFVVAACAVRTAVDFLLANPKRRTRDLGGSLGTRAFTEALVKRIGC
jgi:3-isopropylmalate dehydrogenase